MLHCRSRANRESSLLKHFWVPAYRDDRSQTFQRFPNHRIARSFGRLGLLPARAFATHAHRRGAHVEREDVANGHQRYQHVLRLLYGSLTPDA